MSEGNGKQRVAVGYVRVSTRDQAKDDRYSLRFQESYIKDACARRGYSLQREDIYVDSGISARSARTSRAGLEAALTKACECKGVVVVYAFTRLARSAAHAEQVLERLSKAGADVVSCSDPIDTTTAMGRAMVAIVSVFARLESEMLGERVAAANRQTVKENGYRTQGMQRLGISTAGGVRTENPEEQKTIDLIVGMARNGMGTLAIADWLNDNGIPTTTRVRGYSRQTPGKWYTCGVRRIIQRVEPKLIKARRSRKRGDIYVQRKRH